MKDLTGALDLKALATVNTDTLRKIFHLVCDPDDWKAPISVKVSATSVVSVVEAIRFMTATEPVAKPDADDPMTFTVTSEGYRNGPAGP